LPIVTVAIAALALALAAGCLRKTEFVCNDSTQCGDGNTCESTGYCSFVDSECQRYTESAGPLAGQCVGGTVVDAGLIDTPTTDIDAPNAGCPAGYNDLPTAPGHKYRLLASSESWAAQRQACAATSASAYLAIPDSDEELVALGQLADTLFWVGIEDPTEGMYINVLGQPQTYLPWSPGEPDNGGPGGSDCVASDDNVPLLRDERCQTKYRAVCECVP
jgi:hypothetical protein